MIYDNFIKYVDDGRAGLNRGIPMGFPRLDRYLRGIQKKRYYLIGANTGVGKTAFVDEVFILNPYEWITRTKAKENLKVFYYSFEIDLESKLCKWVAYQIFKDHKIVIDPDHIAGMDMQDEKDEENKLSDEHYQLVLSYREYFEKMFDYIQFEDIAINPTGIKKQVEEYCNSVCKEVSYTKMVEGKEKEIKYYKQNNPNEYVIVIIDHIALLKGEGSLNKKLLIDKMDEYLIQLRNKYRIIPVVISQFNRELGDIQRQKFKELVPILEDFKDSGNTQESANVVIALFSPKRYNLKSYIDYDLKGEIDGKQVVDYFRAMFILKNRGGKDGVRLGMRFLGNCGYFEEIPPPKEFDKAPTMYSKIPDFSKPFNELIKK